MERQQVGGVLVIRRVAGVVGGMAGVRWSAVSLGTVAARCAGAGGEEVLGAEAPAYVALPGVEGLIFVRPGTRWALSWSPQAVGGGTVRRVVMVLAFLVCVVLPACSDHREPEPGWEDTSAATPSRPGSPTSKPRVPGGERVTVRGTVDRGVEPNCLVLSTGERDYLLLGAGPEVRPGTEVVVHGTVRPDQATTCQQGTPLVVDDADLVEGG